MRAVEIEASDWLSECSIYGRTGMRAVVVAKSGSVLSLSRPSAASATCLRRFIAANMAGGLRGWVAARGWVARVGGGGVARGGVPGGCPQEGGSLGGGPQEGDPQVGGSPGVGSPGGVARRVSLGRGP